MPKLVSGTLSLLTLIEKVIPDFYNPDVNIGPVTEFIMNRQFGDNIEYPIQTKQDLIYERVEIEDGLGLLITCRKGLSHLNLKLNVRNF